MAERDLQGRRVVVGVTGGIAAYKACELVSALRKAGAEVRVVLTRNAARFVGPISFATLSDAPVYQDMWAERGEIGHIALADFAEVVIVAPATANIIGKYAHGIADDLLSTALLAFTCPVVIAPAMNTRMLASPPVQANLQLLAERGVRIVEPAEGRLACGDEGAGRLPDTDTLLAAIVEALAPRSLSLEGVRVLVTAGPTREFLDPVRFISNPSSGRMGYALAAEAARRGARVTLVSGPVELEAPDDVEIVRVTTAQEMHQAVQARADGIDVFIGAAAVADWRPVEVNAQKLKKAGHDELLLRLEPTPDIIAEVARQHPRPIVVGFAAETEDLFDNAQRKLQEKGLDLIAANDVSRSDVGFATDANQITLIDASGAHTELPIMSKAEVAAAILDRVEELLAGRRNANG